MEISITSTLSMGDSHPLVVMSGPCVIESEQLCLRIAGELKEISSRLGVSYIFKASFDKANRTSVKSYRGPGLARGLEILRTVKNELSIPVLTDVHEVNQIDAVAEVVDVIQIPAFLCRQTDLLQAAGRSGKSVNIKKGQFMAPHDMRSAVEKVVDTGNQNVFLTERGTTFGYNNLIVDMRSLVIMRSLNVPVVFDATHSVQLPGGRGDSSDGQREFIPTLSRAAAAVGIDGLFLETHPDPENAKSDGPNSVRLEQIGEILNQIAGIHELVRKGSSD
jgi:2-dehydro-3-deoxyphosphooctonate aldolase (KDO 8-P synthase)